MTDTLRYSTTVTAVGALVEDLRAQGMLVLFAVGAPEELHEVCALHEPDVTTGPVSAGDVVVIDGHDLPVTAVGDRANENLSALGHVSLKAVPPAGDDGQGPMPGDICVAASELPAVAPGSTLHVRSGPDGPTTARPASPAGD